MSGFVATRDPDRDAISAQTVYHRIRFLNAATVIFGWLICLKKKMLAKIDVEATELNVVNVPDVASDGSQTHSDGYATELQRNCNGTTLATVIQLQKDRSIGQNRQNYPK
jgi:hypothetical protein